LFKEAVMFRSLERPAAGRQAGWIVVGLLVGVLSAATARAQQPAAPAAQAETTKSPFMFAGDGALVLNYIKADKTADFEMVLGKIKDALAKSEKPERKQQAAGWKIFKSPDPAGANTLYVFVIDPAVKGADYSVANILAEAFPPEQVNELYKQYAGAYAQGQNIINLNMIADLGK
jgi:hypothetical protein